MLILTVKAEMLGWIKVNCCNTLNCLEPSVHLDMGALWKCWLFDKHFCCKRVTLLLSSVKICHDTKQLHVYWLFSELPLRMFCIYNGGSHTGGSQDEVNNNWEKKPTSIAFDENEWEENIFVVEGLGSRAIMENMLLNKATQVACKSSIILWGECGGDCKTWPWQREAAFCDTAFLSWLITILPLTMKDGIKPGLRSPPFWWALTAKLVLFLPAI